VRGVAHVARQECVRNPLLDLIPMLRSLLQRIRDAAFDLERATARRYPALVVYRGMDDLKGVVIQGQLAARLVGTEHEDALRPLHDRRLGAGYGSSIGKRIRRRFTQRIVKNENGMFLLPQ